MFRAFKILVYSKELVKDELISKELLFCHFSSLDLTMKTISMMALLKSLFDEDFDKVDLVYLFQYFALLAMVYFSYQNLNVIEGFDWDSSSIFSIFSFLFVRL